MSWWDAVGANESLNVGRWAELGPSGEGKGARSIFTDKQTGAQEGKGRKKRQENSWENTVVYRQEYLNQHRTFIQ